MIVRHAIRQAEDCKPHWFATKPVFLIAGTALLLAACTENSSLQMGSDAATGTSSGALNLAPPAQLLSARAINLEALIAEVTVNGNTQRFQRSVPFTTTVDVANGDMLNLQVLWYLEEAGSSPLLLTSFSLNQQITGNDTIAINSSDFTSEGSGFDADNDGYSNLRELESNSDPNNSNITPEDLPDVRIPLINPTEAPTIDGLRDTIYDRAVFDNFAGEQLSIDNLMVDQGALRPNGNTEFQWFAMHDDINLYIFVLTENFERGNPTRDSTDPWHDDNISLYFDGNNSKGESYDGFDDRHFYVTFLDRPEDNTNNDSNGFPFAQPGRNSAPIDLDNIEFVTCQCMPQYSWEFKIPLSEVGITKDNPFGFEIQLDIDHDGGTREARWGWFHPARTTFDVDYAWRAPSYMGTAITE